MTDLSVVICTHNPRTDYLTRVLKALQNQTLSMSQWQLVLVDNASSDPLAERFDISWHPTGRHVREEELGLTPARLRGIAESRGEVIVFVDDDNVLGDDYLFRAREISRQYAFLGAWGGKIAGEFEVQPKEWMRPLLGNLAIRDFDLPIWGNDIDNWRAQPCGAGMCVRAKVAKAYARQVQSDEARRSLDRVGKLLTSCGDSDLAQTCPELGLGFGNFPELHLTHLIPENRVRPDYIIRLTNGITTSGIILRYLRTGEAPSEKSVVRVWIRGALVYSRRGWRAAQLYLEKEKAVREGIRSVKILAARRSLAGKFSNGNALSYAR